MNKYWFKQKTYGYGITPISWEGYLVTLLLILAIISLIIVQQGMIMQHFVGLMIILLEIAIITSIFILASKSRTQGALGWKWGNKK